MTKITILGYSAPLSVKWNDSKFCNLKNQKSNLICCDKTRVKSVSSPIIYISDEITSMRVTLRIKIPLGLGFPIEKHRSIQCFWGKLFGLFLWNSEVMERWQTWYIAVFRMWTAGMKIMAMRPRERRGEKKRYRVNQLFDSKLCESWFMDFPEISCRGLLYKMLCLNVAKIPKLSRNICLGFSPDTYVFVFGKCIWLLATFKRNILYNRPAPTWI